MYYKHFFQVDLVFLQKNISWTSKLKIYNNFAYFWHFLDMLRKQVFGGNTWNIKRPNCWWHENMPVLGNPLICTGNLNLRKRFLHLLEHIAQHIHILMAFGNFWMFYAIFSKSNFNMNFKMSRYFWLHLQAPLLLLVSKWKLLNLFS